MNENSSSEQRKDEQVSIPVLIKSSSYYIMIYQMASLCKTVINNIINACLVLLTFMVAIAPLKAAYLTDPVNVHPANGILKNTTRTPDFNLLPDGATFAFWEDLTTYIRVIHVDQRNPLASDENPGTFESPLKTINAAAQRLQPGQKVIIHEGIYRECIQPAKGGTSAANMIAYEAAPGETVIVKGSALWKPQFVPSSGWRLGAPNNTIQVWMADIPEIFFKAYNPFSIRDVYRYVYTWGRAAEPEWLKRALLYRGAVYVNGNPLTQVFDAKELSAHENAFWVEEPGLRLHLSFLKNIDPSTLTIEITTREQLFAPRDFGLGYIRVSGLAFEHAADGLPVPQRAAVSAMRGHHWIIENNRIEWVNATGLDIGSQTWDAEKMEIRGGHIIRNNVIRNIGICGIAGLNLDHTLVENNLIEHIGYLNLERNCESAGLKFHECHNTLIRQNIFRHIKHASGLWFDLNTVNSRITNNVFADIITLYAGILMEINYEPNIIDHNIFWDIKRDTLDDPVTTPMEWSFGDGTAIRADCNEKLIIAHNFFGKLKEHAVSLNTFQAKRIVSGRTGIGYANKVMNNIFFDCQNRIYLAKKYENFIDGNLYDEKNDKGSFLLVYPEPYTFQNLAGWQEFFSLDKHSTQAVLLADFDPETGQLEVSIEGKIPECQNLSTVMNGKVTSRFPGPVPAQVSGTKINIKQKFPLEVK